MLRQDNSVRRMDLNLRLEFWGLDTEIYKLSAFEYCIYCKNIVSKFEDIEEKFEHEIRQMGTAVILTDKKPSTYLEQLENIDLDNPVDSFKASVITEAEFQGFIRGMYPEVDIVRIVSEPGADFKITIEVLDNTTDELCNEMQKVLLERDIGTDDIKIIKVKKEDREIENKEPTISNEKLEAFTRSREVITLSLNKDLQCSAFESGYWFDNAEKIYKGEIRREQIPFYRSGQKCCYMSCSVFDGINIRRVLLLYDIVYIEVPIEEHLERFLQLQDMTKNELIELVSTGKVILVTTNAENRYDIDMLNAAYRENPMGLLGRRAVNVLLAAYFSQMKDRYLRFYPEVMAASTQLYQYGMKKDKAHVVNLAKTLAWPIRAKADSFRYLNCHGVMTLANYGINKLFEEELKLSKDAQLTDKLSFEFSVNSHPIHLAMALNATYIPFQQKGTNTESCYTDYHVADIMENFLTFFWYANQQFSIIKRSRLQQGSEQIRMVESGNEISVLHIAENADKYNTPECFGNIVEKMADLSLEERNKRIREYNDLLVEASEVRMKKSALEWFMTGLDFVPKGPYLSTFLTFSNAVKKGMDDCETILKKHEKRDFIRRVNKVAKDKNLEKTYTEEELDDIYLLDRIHRVARLKIQ